MKQIKSMLDTLIQVVIAFIIVWLFMGFCAVNGCVASQSVILKAIPTYNF